MIHLKTLYEYTHLEVAGREAAHTRIEHAHYASIQLRPKDHHHRQSHVQPCAHRINFIQNQNLCHLHTSYVNEPQLPDRYVV